MFVKPLEADQEIEKIAFTSSFSHMVGLTAFRQSASFGDSSSISMFFEDSSEKFSGVKQASEALCEIFLDYLLN